VSIAICLTRNALVDDRVLLQEPRCRFDQISRVMAAAPCGWLLTDPTR
jgi:hypothetical protein